MRAPLLLLLALLLAGCSTVNTPATPAPPGPTDAAPSPTPSAPAPPTASAATPAVSVNITGFAFAPERVGVPEGSEVVWTNRDRATHTVTADDGSFDSGALANGATFRHTLPADAKDVRYHCEIHPGMTGVLNPSGEPAAGPSTQPTAAPSPAPTAAPAARTVVIDGFAFEPADVTIPVGGAVTWSNYDAASHTATSSDGAFDSGALAKDGTFTRAFDAPGTYAYVCRFHPSMTGTVTVA